MVDRGNGGGVVEENHLERCLKGVKGGVGGSRHSGEVVDLSQCERCILRWGCGVTKKQLW